MIVIIDDELYLETYYDETVFKLNYAYYNLNYNNYNFNLNAIDVIPPIPLNRLPSYNIVIRDYVTHDGIMYNNTYLNVQPFPVSFTKTRCTNRIHLRNTEVSIYSNTGRVRINNVEVNHIIFNPIFSRDYVRYSSKRFMGKLIRDTYTISNCLYTHDSK